MDQASRLALDIGYSVITGRNIDYAKIILYDLLVGLSKEDREKNVPYVRFISDVLQRLLGPIYPTEGDYQLSKLGNRLLDRMPEDGEVSLSTLLTSSTITSSLPLATKTATKPRSLNPKLQRAHLLTPILDLQRRLRSNQRRKPQINR